MEGFWKIWSGCEAKDRERALANVSEKGRIRRGNISRNDAKTMVSGILVSLDSEGLSLETSAASLSPRLPPLSLSADGSFGMSDRGTEAQQPSCDRGPLSSASTTATTASLTLQKKDRAPKPPIAGPTLELSQARTLPGVPVPRLDFSKVRCHVSSSVPSQKVVQQEVTTQTVLDHLENRDLQEIVSAALND